jgi:hypothetical protein
MPPPHQPFRFATVPRRPPRVLVPPAAIQFVLIVPTSPLSLEQVEKSWLGVRTQMSGRLLLIRRQTPFPAYLVGHDVDNLCAVPPFRLQSEDARSGTGLNRHPRVQRFCLRKRPRLCVRRLDHVEAEGSDADVGIGAHQRRSLYLADAWAVSLN